MESLVGKNILVTGGNGFVGSNLSTKLLSLGSNVYIPCGRDEDIKSYSKVLAFISRYEIDYIFHLAAQTIVGTAKINPLETLKTNIIGTANVLEAARHCPRVRGVLVTSSDKAYGSHTGKYTEKVPLHGDYPYDVSKSSADLIAQSYYKTYGLPVVITRAANIYGPGDTHFNRLVPGVMKALIRGEVFEVRSDGTFTRDYTFVEDILDAFIALMENIDKTKGEAYNISSGENYSVIDLIDKIATIVGRPVQCEILGTAQSEIQHQSLSCQKIKKAVGWKAKHKLERVVPETYEWYQEYLA